MIINDDRTDETVEGIIASVFERDPRYCTQRLHRENKSKVRVMIYCPLYCIPHSTISGFTRIENILLDTSNKLPYLSDRPLHLTYNGCGYFYEMLHFLQRKITWLSSSVSCCGEGLLPVKSSGSSEDERENFRSCSASFKKYIFSHSGQMYFFQLLESLDNFTNSPCVTRKMHIPSNSL